MKRNCLVVCLIAVLVCLCCSAYADWEATKLLPNTGDGWLLVTPTYTINGSDYIYSYNVKNETATDRVMGFTIVIPWAVPVNEFTDIVTPTGWEFNYTRYNVGSLYTNKVNWDINGNESIAIQSGESKTFGFTSKYGPSATQDASASSANMLGYTGYTYGPVPEPGSLAALFMGLAGLGMLKLRKK